MESESLSELVRKDYLVYIERETSFIAQNPYFSQASFDLIVPLLAQLSRASFITPQEGAAFLDEAEKALIAAKSSARYQFVGPLRCASPPD